MILRAFVLILAILSNTSGLFAQIEESFYSRKICFSNLNGRIYFDTLESSVTSQVILASALNIKFDKVASPKQTEKLLANSHNSSTDDWRIPSDSFQYLLTTKFILRKDTFKVASRVIEHSGSEEDFKIPQNHNIDILYFLEDTLMFFESRTGYEDSFLKFVPENHLISKVIAKDIDGDKIKEIVLISNSVYIGSIEAPAQDGGPEECWIQILKKRNGTYESIFKYEPWPILKYVLFFKLNGDSNFSLIIGSKNSYRDSFPKLEILSKGKWGIGDCVQDLTY